MNQVELRFGFAHADQRCNQLLPELAELVFHHRQNGKGDATFVEPAVFFGTPSPHRRSMAAPRLACGQHVGSFNFAVAYLHPLGEGIFCARHWSEGGMAAKRLTEDRNPAKLKALRYDAVLLDIDGTLVDSNGAHAAAWSEAFAAHGRSHSPEEIRPLIGKGGDKLLRELASLDHESGEGKAISEARTEIFRTRYLPTLRPTPGAVEFVAWLTGVRLTVVVATSAKEEEVKALLAVCGGQAFVKNATTSDDAERSKPDPDILSAALEKSGAASNRTLMIGDTPYDLEAATRAGIVTIALRSGGWDDATLHGAIAIYDHPRALLKRLGESPFYAAPSQAVANGLPS